MLALLAEVSSGPTYEEGVGLGLCSGLFPDPPDTSLRQVLEFRCTPAGRGASTDRPALHREVGPCQTCMLPGGGAFAFGRAIPRWRGSQTGADAGAVPLSAQPPQGPLRRETPRAPFPGHAPCVFEMTCQPHFWPRRASLGVRAREKPQSVSHTLLGHRDPRLWGQDICPCPSGFLESRIRLSPWEEAKGLTRGRLKQDWLL